MTEWNVKTIIAGYDGSPGADRAIELAAALAKTYAAKVVVVSAFPPYPKLTVPKPTDDLGIKEAIDLAGIAVERLRERGVEAEPDAPEGPSADAILNAAEAREADLIIVGGLGHSRVAGLLLGSTSENVARHSTIPVLIAR